MVNQVANGLRAPPSAISVAEFSMLCNRKDTCRSLVTSSVETAATNKIPHLNVIAVDFAVSTTIGTQAPVYSWIRATSG